MSFHPLCLRLQICQNRSDWPCADETILYLSCTPNEPSNAAQAAAGTLIYAFDLVMPLCPAYLLR